MGKDSAYYKEKKTEQTIRLRHLLKTLPQCAVDYIYSKEVTTQISTRIQYAYDLDTFFRFLKESNPYFEKKAIKEIQVEDLSSLRSEDIMEYQRFLELNIDEKDYHESGKRGIARRMAPLRGMFKYLTLHKYLKEDPCSLVPLPRIKKDKNIIRMNSAEVRSVFQVLTNGSDQISDRQKKFLEKTHYRDIAVITLLLNTGIRVSECNGLDLNDVNLSEDTIVIVRKGGAQDVLYFGEDVHDALKDYLELERASLKPREGQEKAFFLSLQGKRMSVDAIENLVRKFSRIAVPNKHITPHKLRSTYGTALYRETGDIRLVADVLGHENINTTIDYYAAIEDEHKKEARNAVDFKKNFDHSKNGPTG